MARLQKIYLKDLFVMSANCQNSSTKMTKPKPTKFHSRTAELSWAKHTRYSLAKWSCWFKLSFKAWYWVEFMISIWNQKRKSLSTLNRRRNWDWAWQKSKWQIINPGVKDIKFYVNKLFDVLTLQVNHPFDFVYSSICCLADERNWPHTPYCTLFVYFAKEWMSH